MTKKLYPMMRTRTEEIGNYNNINDLIEEVTTFAKKYGVGIEDVSLSIDPYEYYGSTNHEFNMSCQTLERRLKKKRSD